MNNIYIINSVFNAIKVCVDFFWTKRINILYWWNLIVGPRIDLIKMAEPQFRSKKQHKSLTRKIQKKIKKQSKWKK